ncbi:cytosine deaminase, putative [Theileria equi strain WA]|uniref:Cytosine deaminase, putative n=1 Tax=Theileria equi strain WA TaxID=1537102 RepID=L1LCH5_THEEQ|nr:cytosine deaminase, putative [Theileria equi strain WA]EKX73142.1 cytosine deaminase, putative [Theileria equi strain WA]|eukprot:XP_004832594.1 cytosine deaminase, putative [Theileria equi strain WA]
MAFSDSEVLYFMNKALDEAKIALDLNEVTVGCIIVCKSTREIVASSSNTTNLTHNSTWHCELDAINKLLSLNPDKDLSANNTENLHKFSSKYALFVTCEPCIMCTTALQIVGLTDVYYGCSNDKFGGCGSVLSLHKSNGDLPRINCRGGILADDAIKLLQTFYSRGNPNAPEPKRKRKIS